MEVKAKFLSTGSDVSGLSVLNRFPGESQRLLAAEADRSLTFLSTSNLFLTVIPGGRSLAGSFSFRRSDRVMGLDIVSVTKKIRALIRKL
jgi:hypothetical protein